LGLERISSDWIRITYFDTLAVGKHGIFAIVGIDNKTLDDWMTTFTLFQIPHIFHLLGGYVALDILCEAY